MAGWLAWCDLCLVGAVVAGGLILLDPDLGTNLPIFEPDKKGAYNGYHICAQRPEMQFFNMRKVMHACSDPGCA